MAKIPRVKTHEYSYVKMWLHTLIGVISMESHGMFESRIYKVWTGMKQRCDNKNNVAYKNYGGRGISYDKSWEKFTKFYADMGDPPKGLTIDRIDNNGNYCKENCRWVSKKVQQNNMRTTIFLVMGGVRLSIHDWADKIGIDYEVLHGRHYKLGWSDKRTLTEKVRLKNKLFLYKGKEYRIGELAKMVGLNTSTLSMRMSKQGWTLERAMKTKVGVI